jgi:hypothetical protein
MEVLFPEERHQIVLIVREERDAVETAQESSKLLELETGAEREPPNAVAVEKKRKTVGSIGALEDDLRPAAELGLRTTSCTRPLRQRTCSAARRGRARAARTTAFFES